MNPLAALKIKGALTAFKENHPKIPPFFKAAAGIIDEGSIIEMTITSSEGKRIVTNLKVTENDLEQINAVKELF